jgi:hypothetical protein
MKIIAIALLATSCVGIPKYVERYTCNENQKLRLPEVFAECLQGMDTRDYKEPSKSKAKYCYEYSLMATCHKTPHYQHRDFLGRDLAPQDCAFANTAWEKFACEGM